MKQQDRGVGRGGGSDKTAEGDDEVQTTRYKINKTAGDGHQILSDCWQPHRV